MASANSANASSAKLNAACHFGNDGQCRRCQMAVLVMLLTPLAVDNDADVDDDDVYNDVAAYIFLVDTIVVRYNFATHYLQFFCFLCLVPRTRASKGRSQVHGPSYSCRFKPLHTPPTKHAL